MFGTYEGYELVKGFNRKSFIEKVILIIYSNYNVKLKSYDDEDTGDLTFGDNNSFLIKTRSKKTGKRRFYVFKKDTEYLNLIVGVKTLLEKGAIFSSSILLEKSLTLNYHQLSSSRIDLNSIEEFEENKIGLSKIDSTVLKGFFADNNSFEYLKKITKGGANFGNNEMIVELRKELEQLKNEQDQIKNKISEKLNREDKDGVDKEALKKLLLKNRVKELIQKLMRYYEKKSIDKFDELVLLGARLERVETDIRINILNREQGELVISQINFELIRLINQVEN